VEASGNLTGVAYLLGQEQVTTTNRDVHASRRSAENVFSSLAGCRRDAGGARGGNEAAALSLPPPPEDGSVNDSGTVRRKGLERGQPVGITAFRDEPASTESTRVDVSARTLVASGPSADCTDLARIARRVRLLIPNASGDVRAELEEIRAELEALVGPVASVTSLASRRPKG